MIKTSKSAIKVLAMILISLLILVFSGCSSDNNEKCDKNDDVVVKYDIISARYIHHEGIEKFHITYINSDGKYQTESVDPDYWLEISDENKVVITNPDGFFSYSKTFVLTADTYNQIINASPNIYEIE